MHVSNFLVCVSYIYSVLYVHVYLLSVEIHVKEPALCICNIKMQENRTGQGRLGAINV